MRGPWATFGRRAGVGGWASRIRGTGLLLDILFGEQPTCALCSSPAARRDRLCEPCQAGLPLAVGARCGKCSAPIRLRGEVEGGAAGDAPTAPLCRGCQETQHYFAAASAVAVYEGAARTMVADLKYRARLELALPMARLMAAECARVGFAHRCDVAVPVPMHRAKLALRGYNQAEVLCTEVARALWMPQLPDVLTRSELQESQTLHDRAGRRANALRAYSCVRPKAVAGRSVLVVDDVLTSGATADGCARALLRAGAREVCVITFAVSVADARDWIDRSRLRSNGVESIIKQ
ncbi:MAG: ComF family protein [Bacillota bacterium]|jgi:ComF family protein|nr:ComF family protein [Bacillota bacterium]